MDMGTRVPETKSVSMKGNTVQKLAVFVLIPLAVSFVIGVLVESESPVLGWMVARGLIETLSKFTAPIWLLVLGGGSILAWRMRGGNPPTDRRNPWYWGRLFWKTFLPMVSAFVGYIVGTSVAIRVLLR